MTVGETSIFACSVAHDTYNINHQFNCNDRRLIYIITCKHYNLVNLLICQTSKSSNVDEIIIMTETCMQEHLLRNNYLAQVGYLNDVSITFIDIFIGEIP